MEEKIKVDFGILRHGWLPIEFQFKNFKLNIFASFVLSNPLIELEKVVNNNLTAEFETVNFWEEPGAYIFGFKKVENEFALEIFETSNLHNTNSSEKMIFALNGDFDQIIAPFKKALEKYRLEN